MRIVGGRYRGRALAPAPRSGVRPTADPVREALFNILADDVVDEPFFDLCAGTGAVGLEALSRGARPVVLVERSRAALRVIEKNLERLGIADQEEAPLVLARDVAAFLAEPERWSSRPAGVVFVDPPYGERRLFVWLEALAAGPLLGPDSLVVVEHASRTEPQLGGLERLWTRRYGDSALTACLAPDRTG